MMEILREVTEWDNSEFVVPNHTYLFDGKSNIPFKGVPYSHNDSGIKNFQNNGIEQ